MTVEPAGAAAVGATVLAIQRGQASVLVPSGHERVLSGDTLAIAGAQEAIEKAKRPLEVKG